jgi:hypothetical protein
VGAGEGPEEKEGVGEVPRAEVGPSVDNVGMEPIAAFDFGGLEDERAFGKGEVDPDELLSSLGAGGEVEETLGWGVGGETEFLLKFAQGGGIVVFAGVEVTGAGGIPGTGEAIFEEGTFLEEDVALLVDDEDVHGPVFEAESMDFRAGSAVDGLIVVVDDIEPFFRHGRDRVEDGMEGQGEGWSWGGLGLGGG